MIKNFREFKESLIFNSNNSDLLESLKVWHDLILSSIGANLVDIFSELNLPKEEFQKILDVDILSKNVDFFNSLNSLGLKFSPIQRSDDFQTFVNKPCKFMMIYDFRANELENPDYILFQTYNDSLKKWDDAKLYSIEEDIKKFYDKLTSKTIEISDGGENYIYITSNGNDWELQNSEKENDVFKRFLRKEELEEVINSKNPIINII
jgi:wyosine [tRNA(Phe)-imidazoG37] synthetase (radical SAM superfamily)